MKLLSQDWHYVDNRARSLYKRIYNEQITGTFETITPYMQDFFRTIARAVIQKEEEFQERRVQSRCDLQAGR